MSKQKEVGWLIERLRKHAIHGTVSTFTALGQCNGQWRWVTFDQAIRFSRKQDAEQIGRAFLDKSEVWEAVEHGWE